MWPFSRKKKKGANGMNDDKPKEKDPKEDSGSIPIKDKMNDTQYITLDLAESLDELKKAKSQFRKECETAKLKAKSFGHKSVR